MKKLLSLSLAIVMMLGCILGQTVLVSAATAVDYTNAPYAGVYQVTSDKAVTLTNETGHTVTLAAGATDYFYLIQGANNLTTTDSTANVTFTALEDNGLAYIAQVAISSEPITGPEDAHDPTSGAAGITLAAGESRSFTHTPNYGAGIYYPYISGTEGGTLKVTTDTGYYAEILLRGGSSSAWTDGSNKKDPEMVYLRDGAQTITLTNTSSSSVVINTTSFGTTSVLAENADWKPQMKMAELKVVNVEITEPTPTPGASETAYTGSYAGVYAISADAATTVTTEIGSVAELEAGETGYVYLLKGANVLTNSTGANLTISELTGNGLEYLDQVTAEIPLAPSSISELTLSGNFTNAQGSYNDYGATGVALGSKASIDVTLTAPAAGLYVTQIQFVYGNADQITVESDAGFYGVINQQAGRAGWNELHQGTHGVGQQDMEIMFLRAGANTITIKNTGVNDTLITKIKLAKTGSLASLEAYNWQLNLENLKPVLAVSESFVNATGVNVDANELAFFGKVGAEYLDFKYGIEFSSNKSGTRAQKYYGAKSGDIVSDGAEGTTTFTFGDWDGSFEIILQGVSLGDKEYRFFVGNEYTAYDIVTVE